MLGGPWLFGRTGLDVLRVNVCLEDLAWKQDVQRVTGIETWTPGSARTSRTTTTPSRSPRTSGRPFARYSLQARLLPAAFRGESLFQLERGQAKAGSVFFWRYPLLVEENQQKVRNVFLGAVSESFAAVLYDCSSQLRCGDPHEAGCEHTTHKTWKG